LAFVGYQREGNIAIITLNRAERLNALSVELASDLDNACQKCEKDSEVRVAILTANGKAFSAGADMKDAGLGKATLDAGPQASMRAIQKVTKPVVAAVNGLAIGVGCSLVMGCDIRIAAEGAQFGWPNVRWGISSVGGPAFLPHYLPRNIGYEYLFTGELYSAEDAFRFGMVNRVVPEDDLIPTAEELARKILRNAPLAVQAMKEATLLGLELPIVQRLRVSKMVAARVAGTEDATEGRLSFIEKRQPVWKGV